LTALSERFLRFLGRRHAAVPNHSLGQPDGYGGVGVFAVDMLDVSQASGDPVLYAPRFPPRRPLDRGPQLACNFEAVEPGAVLDLDHAVPARIVDGGELRRRGRRE